MDCQNIVFSPNQSQKRIKRVLRILPLQVLKKIIFCALYLLGARINEIALLVEMPEESVKTTIRRVMRDGLSALFDRRQSTKTSGLQQPSSVKKAKASVSIEEDCCIITFEDMDHQLKIPLNHRVHLRTVLFSLFQSNLLTSHTVSSVLGITAAHCQTLSTKLMNYGVTDVLVDKRKGQKQDFRVDSSVKAKLIQYFAARAVTGYSISSQALAEIINDAGETDISARTIRWHMNKLGLITIKKTLPELVKTLRKKTSELLFDAGINLTDCSSSELLPFQANIQPFSRTVCRKSAIVLASNGFTVSATAALAGCCTTTVSRSILRMTDTGDVVDLPRSGREPVYSKILKLELIGFYCQTQPFHNAGRWTLRWAAAHLAAHPECINAAPGKSSIHRMLKENNLKPHQSRYFLHITDPNFFPKMEHLITLYSKPPENLFCFDECPGIQILKRLVPDLRTDGMKKRLEEFEYIRNGTMNVLAFFKYADGKVYAECKGDHKTDTFLGMFRRHAASCPAKEQLHYVMDNLSTHRGYPFCKAVAELSDTACPSENQLNNLEKRVEWLKSADKRIVIHFTPYHGSWLNLVEFWFGIMNKKVLDESYGSAQELMESFEAFLEEWNTLHAHPFQWSYDGKGLHGKAVNRFIAMLMQAADKLEISTLTKQLRLMSNLFDHYLSEVPKKSWEKLFDVLQSQAATLKNSIRDEEGPIKKANAENAMNSLCYALLLKTTSYRI